MSTQSSPEELEAKQKAHFEKARKGVLKFINDKGGSASLDEMHDYSLNRYLVQHQGFSLLMETLVDEKFIDYDFQKGEAKITEAGKNFMVQ